MMGVLGWMLLGTPIEDVSPPAPFEVPARVMFEAIVTIGVSTWAWSLAKASNQSPGRWAVLTMAGAFGVHRVCEWVVSSLLTADPVFDSQQHFLRIVGPVLGSIVVFMAAPLVLGSAIRVRPPKRARVSRAEA